ncbi:MAG: hypothetical protein N2110_00070 [Flavobacteriales bacterium]|nr:hypothetical protein [Flavobacteriales bacterium]MCX7767404.1 hypothetical protein [Flavobacteriales bacterium]MDW8410180.1 hypothetical protein [Flavobacteriales bacterium]
MKKLKILFLFALGILLFECKGSKDEIARKQAIIDSLTLQINQKDSSVNEFLRAFNEIEESLQNVQAQQTEIQSGAIAAGESNVDVKTRIEEKIRAINEAMTASRNKMAELQQRLKKSNLKIVELEKMISRLSATLAEKDAEIAALNERLIAMNYKVEGLTQEVATLRSEKETVTRELEAKTKEAEEKTVELNTVFYVVGTKKELIEKGVLSKEGEFSGPRARGKLGVTFNEKSFTRADLRQLGEVLINGKKARLLSSHPAGSYTLSGEKLTITNPQQFWKASRYCVVEVVK